jgi:hypothetical protein
MNPIPQNSQTLSFEPELPKAMKDRASRATVEWGGGFDRTSNAAAIGTPAGALGIHAWMLKGIPELNSPLAG